jgi:hypothetical protein
MAEPSTEPKSNTCERRWNWDIVAIFIDLWRQHNREKPLGKAPGVREFVIAISKTCKYPTAGTVYLPTGLSML